MAGPLLCSCRPKTLETEKQQQLKDKKTKKAAATESTTAATAPRKKIKLTKPRCVKYKISEERTTNKRVEYFHLENLVSTFRFLEH